ncbi:MAG TPA: secretin N-terminal domain-containing protein, partial [Porticoccaceae bacterium]
MNKLTLTSLMLALAMAGCATTQTPPQQPVATVRGASEQQPAETVEDVPTVQEPIIYRGNDRVVNLPEVRAPASLSGSGVTLNFEEAPITEVVHSILGEILQLDYIVEHPLKGEVTLRTRAPVPRDQLLSILESLLQTNGARMVRDANDRYLVSASPDVASLMPGFTNANSAGAGFANVIFPLRYISASEMARILAPVAPDSAFVRVDNSRNLLVLAGTRNQIDGWQEIISTFDIDQLQGMSVGIFPIENSTVEEVGAALNHLLSNEPGGEGVPGAGLASIVRIMPLERLNSILVVTPRAHYLDQMRTWIERLDRSADSSGEATLHVYAVQNGSATHLGQLLSSI